MSALPVVVGVDGSTFSARAVRWAARAASIRSAPLLLVAANLPPGHCYDGGFGIYDGLVQCRRDTRDALLSDAAQIAADEAHDLDVRVDTDDRGDPLPCLLDHAVRSQMIVLGANRTLGYSGRIVRAVAKTAPCPVVVVRRRLNDRLPTGPVMLGLGRVVDDGAARAAFGEASALGVDLVAVRAWFGGDEVEHGAESTAWSRELDEYDRLENDLNPWRKVYPHVHVVHTVALGAPPPALLEHASRAQLLVVGRRPRRRGSSTLFHSSVVRSLLRRYNRPLMIVAHNVEM